MLKTQITGAKYLSPQTNQMTNLNIAVPADSKDTEFGTSDILLAKDVVAYLNALDSDISNELDAQTDKINKINESIKQLIDHNLIKIVTELPTTDIDKNCIYLVPNKDGEGNNVFIEYIYVESKNTFEEVGRIQAKVDLSDYYTKEETDNQIQIAKNSAINIHNEADTKSIKLDINDTEAAGEYGGSTVNMSLTDDDASYIVNINAVDGFRHTTDDSFTSNLNGYGLITSYGDYTQSCLTERELLFNTFGNGIIELIKIGINYDDEYNYIEIGSDKKFKISRPTDNTEGATITGVKSIAAFANPSATKVWATDGSTVDLTTKANTSDVLLKKSADGGYYISDNIYKIGSNSFAANSTCKADGTYAFAECGSTTASGTNSHAEGTHTIASGFGSHSEGFFTKASGTNSHAEGRQTVASGYCSHAQGYHNVDNKNAIHSVGIGNSSTIKNAEYIYVKNDESGTPQIDDPKNGYKYLIGVGGYDGISTDNTTYKSVQEVIADLTARIEQLETKVRALEAANTPA